MKKFFLLANIAMVILMMNDLCAQQLYVKQNLKPDWLVYDNNAYIPFDQHKNISTVYIRLDARQHAKSILEIKSSKSFDLFLNGMMAASGKKLQLKVDSLSAAFASTHLLIAIHQENLHPDRISTMLLTSDAPALTDTLLVKRESSAYRDFVILGGLILVIMLLIITRLNRKLAADYLSVTRMFSLREGDDSQMFSRIASSTNILFYVFCSLLISYYLIVIFHFVGSVYPVAVLFQADSFGEIVWEWLRLSGILLSFLFLKILLVFTLSYLFGITEIPGIHFFNWIRLLVVLFGLLTSVLFIYIIWHGNAITIHTLFLKLLGWFMGGWMILIFLKLSARGKASMFHLFSYICATELIPFLIILKVLYN